MKVKLASIVIENISVWALMPFFSLFVFARFKHVTAGLLIKSASYNRFDILIDIIPLNEYETGPYFFSIFPKQYDSLFDYSRVL